MDINEMNGTIQYAAAPAPLLFGLEVNSRLVIWSVLLGTFSVLAWYRATRQPFPTINAYPWDFTPKRAYKAYNENARGLIIEGFAKFQGPFRILTPTGARLILPSSYFDWARNCKDVDHQQLVYQDFFAGYSGFDGQRFVSNPDRILIDMTKTKMSQHAYSINIMNEKLPDILRETWTENHDWHLLDWQNDTMGIISYLSALIFVGPKLASDAQWRDLTVTYTVNVFAAVGALRKWPPFMRPLVHPFLAESEKCREQVRLAQKLMQPTLAQRKKEKEPLPGRDEVVAHYDGIEWLEEVAAGRPYDPVGGQLGLALGALHTTSEAFKQVIVDLCLHPELIEPIRDEIREALSATGMTMAALAKMELLDSVLKESQRFTAASVGVERKVIRNTKLPNGITIPHGTILAIDSSEMWNSQVHENPLEYDGFRFQRLRHAGEKGSNMAAFASSTKEHMTFGAGRFICPGRFFVANQLKLVLSDVLMKYDIRLQDGCAPKITQAGFYGLTSSDTRVEVRRRVGT